MIAIMSPPRKPNENYSGSHFVTNGSFHPKAAVIGDNVHIVNDDIRINRVAKLLEDYIKMDFDMLVKCQYCGQWGARMCACKHCGGAIE